MASIRREFEQGAPGSRPLLELFHLMVRAMPTRCDHCGGRVVRTDPMAAKSCNRCGLWAE